jgi:outer membrane protein OmpA-like peptidoglycan-associated protein
MRGIIVVVVLSSFDPVAAAEPEWLPVLEANGAVPVDGPQDSWFGAGTMPAAGIYRATGPWLLFGARLRAGFLVDGDAPGNGLMDPDTGGLGTLTASARVRPLARPDDPAHGTGPWIELAGGGAVTGDLVRPTYEIGVGWGFPLGGVNLGPSLRYLQVMQPNDEFDGRDAQVALLGVELSLFDGRTAPPPAPIAEPVRVVEAPSPKDTDGDGILDPDDKCPTEAEDADGFQDADGCPDPDNDGDGILDAADKCPLEAEVMNGVDDEDGCPDEGLFQVIEDRIILEERVLFDTNRARVRSAGKPVLKAIIDFWAKHPEWERVVIEGHADERGTDKYNQWLSETRSQRVRDALVSFGVEAGKIDVKGYGKSRPRDQRHNEKAWERNRRVEFVLIRKRTVPAAPGEGTPAGEPAPAPETAPAPEPAPQPEKAPGGAP